MISCPSCKKSINRVNLHDVGMLLLKDEDVVHHVCDNCSYKFDTFMFEVRGILASPNKEG